MNMSKKRKKNEFKVKSEINMIHTKSFIINWIHHFVGILGMCAWKSKSETEIETTKRNENKTESRFLLNQILKVQYLYVCNVCVCVYAYVSFINYIGIKLTHWKFVIDMFMHEYVYIVQCILCFEVWMTNVHFKIHSLQMFINTVYRIYSCGSTTYRLYIVLYVLLQHPCVW